VFKISSFGPELWERKHLALAQPYPKWKLPITGTVTIRWRQVGPLKLSSARANSSTGLYSLSRDVYRAYTYAHGLVVGIGQCMPSYIHIGWLMNSLYSVILLQSSVLLRQPTACRLSRLTLIHGGDQSHDVVVSCILYIT